MAKEKRIKRKRKNRIKETLFRAGASFITMLDEILDEAGEILMDGKEALFDVCAGVIMLYDRLAELIIWGVNRTFVRLARRYHEIRVKIYNYRRTLMKYFLGAVVVTTGFIAIFSSITDYEYAYNGRTLGIVHDQQDVLEIMDLVSEELTQEYGSSIAIDPETDITFRPVISYGREIDDADAVLRRFTYMGDIQTQASAIYANGELIAVVESDKIADEVLQEVLDYYCKGDAEDYEYIGFAEDIQIKPYNTTLARVTSRSSAYKKIRSGGQQEVTYKVKAGDTLYGICEELGITLDELIEMNPKLDNVESIHIGDQYVIAQEVPLLTVETVEIATYAEPVKYKTEYQKSSAYYEGEEVISQQGENGKARITARLTKHNGKTVKKKVLDTEVIKKPTKKIVVKGTKKVPPKQGTGTFIRPVNVPIYSGYGWRWGRMHYGIDLPCATGTPIRAADGGTVTLAGWYYGYGYTVIIDHGGGFTTLYGHCSALYVSVGERVYQGQTIAAVGNTGNSYGSHCHFEIKKNGVNVNPSNYV